MKKDITLLMPSNRNFGEAINSIEYFRSFCETNQIKGIVCDSSGSGEKEAYFTTANSRHLSYIKNENKEINNWELLLGAAYTRWIGWVGDDDIILNTYNPIRFPQTSDPSATHSADYITLTPTFSTFTSSGFTRQINFPKSNTSPMDAKTFRDTSKGANVFFYAWHERLLWGNLFYKFKDNLPFFEAGYWDWTFSRVLSILSNTKKIEGVGFLYNAGNWEGNSTEIQGQVENLFTRAGFEKEISTHLPALNGADLIIILESIDPQSFHCPSEWLDKLISESINGSGTARQKIEFLADYLDENLRRAHPEAAETYRRALKAIATKLK